MENNDIIDGKLTCNKDMVIFYTAFWGSKTGEGEKFDIQCVENITDDFNQKYTIYWRKKDSKV